MCNFCYDTEEDSIRSKGQQEEMQGNWTEDLEKNDMSLSDSPRFKETEKSMKREDGKLRRLSSGVSVSFQGKNVKINIPLTTPSQAISAISYLLKEDFINQSSSRNYGPESGKLDINKTKLHHAEKMIKGGFIELYKGLEYLKIYRYNNPIFHFFDTLREKKTLINVPP